MGVRLCKPYNRLVECLEEAEWEGRLLEVALIRIPTDQLREDSLAICSAQGPLSQVLRE